MTPITKKESDDYAAAGGASCPKCGSADIEAGKLSAESDVAWCKVGCLTCDAEWQEIYTLSGICHADGSDPVDHKAEADDAAQG